MKIQRSTKILGSKDEIKAYLGIASDHSFRKFIERGMPAVFEDKRWLAHAENIDDFIKGYTRKQLWKMPGDDEIADECMKNGGGQEK